MSELRPIPFERLVTRMFTELDARKALFDLPERRFFLGDAQHDLSLDLFGRRAASPLGPAAGPHTQLAQNLVLAWLGGMRVMELKTVQVRDDLEISRPCIDMRNIGFNVEWSQELSLAQALEEYVKGAMLIEMLASSRKLSLQPGFGDTVFDLSVGYDLAGIRSAKLARFFDGMGDATAVIERLRAQIPTDYKHLRDLPFATRLSDTVTLSTFHGCPPDEIEAIADFLLRERQLHTVVKLNPTLLGKDQLHAILGDDLGYTHLRVPDDAFLHDTTWSQAVAFCERLAATARQLGRGFGVKFSNTLITENDGAVLPASEPRAYLSGAPLHVLAMTLVAQFRERFGSDVPVSFSAGIDKGNAAAAVALGLRPVTMCTDLLKPGGYSRGQAYLQALTKAMADVSAQDLDTFVVRGLGQARASLADLRDFVDETTFLRCQGALDAGNLRDAAGTESFARLRNFAIIHNTRAYLSTLRADPRYRWVQNNTTPKKVGSHLALFDCLTCDICIAVCPNDANFAFSIESPLITVHQLEQTPQGWHVTALDTLRIARRHQIANFADACNDCGNCDTFCPESGGPYKVKPALFGSAATFAARPERDGVWIEAGTVHGRFGGQVYRMGEVDGRLRYSGRDFDITVDKACLQGARPVRIEGTAAQPVDLRWLVVMGWLARGLADGKFVHF